MAEQLLVQAAGGYASTAKALETQSLLGLPALMLLGAGWAGHWPGTVTGLSLSGAGHCLVHWFPVPHPGLISGILGGEG